ncbi:MAG TPA: adenosylcobinamide-GDP ribazoletransferase [Rhizobacter sp.]|jgi:adenosylcobinamide-GDP ribazoletransferase|nr:adenosylcobinamide-GDP ribazoletransferase [Rhizobacter sp.]
MILHELRLFFIALQFFTRLPVPRWVGYQPEWLHESARHFPLVGALVGAVGAGVLWAALVLFPMPVAVGLSMAATVLLTGAFHEDGLADTCDALGGAVSRERALEIMKDSRIGSYGAVGLLLVLGLKAVTLVALPAPVVFAALILGHTASRAAAVALIRWLPYAGDVAHAKAKPLAQRVSAAGFAVAWAWVVAVGGALVLWHAAWWPLVLMGIAAAVVCAVACALWLKRRLGGMTGDTLGATQQLSELLVLLACLAWLRF